MRIRTRLLILVLSVLVPSFIATGLAISFVYNAQQEAKARSVGDTTRAFAMLVENELRSKAALLQALANSPSLERGDLGEFYAHAKRLAPNWESTVILADLDGKQLLNTRAPLGSALPTRRVSNMGELMRRFGNDRMLVSDLFRAPIGGRHDFTIQVPVKIGNVIRYYLVLGTSTDVMQRLVDQQHFRDRPLISIVDRNGIVVARSRHPQRYVGKPARERTRQHIMAAAEGAYESPNLEGVMVNAFFSTVPSSDWKVVLSVPSNEIRRVPIQAAALLGTLMAVLLVLGTLAARWFANRSIAPIEYLGQAAQQLGQGKDLSCEPQGILEIDAVALRMAEASSRIRHAQNELEHKVAEAVAATERAQGALLKSQKLEALGRLTGGLAHEFNNLLQTLTTALRLAEMTTDQPQVKNLIQTCKRTVNRASALTGQLGSFGRVQEARLATVDVEEQIGSAVQLMKGALQDNIAVQVDCATGVWPVTIEPLQFDLALLNLAINARDAMPGGGTLRIEARNLEPDEVPAALGPGQYVRVCVADTGSGMPPEVLSRALDPFFTTKPQGHGTGLGLAQAFAFATQSQGTLQIDSKPGKGTRVDIYLPRALAPSPDAAPQGEAESMTTRGKGTVLFVEDDALVRETVVRALRESGFEVLLAEDGDTALRMLEAGARPDTIFSDIVMPGHVSGIDLAVIVRERYPALRVVLASGYTEQQVALPGVRVLAKPYPIEDVVALLSQAAYR